MTIREAVEASWKSINAIVLNLQRRAEAAEATIVRLVIAINDHSWKVEAMPDEPRGEALGAYYDLLQQLAATHKAKDADYAGAIPYANFRISEALGIPAWLGAAIRMSDKWQRVATLIARERATGAGPAVADEKLEDTLLDLANYALIIVVLRRERGEKK